MCVYKYHAFIYFLRPPPWSRTITNLTMIKLVSVLFSELFVIACTSIRSTYYTFGTTRYILLRWIRIWSVLRGRIRIWSKSVRIRNTAAKYTHWFQSWAQHPLSADKSVVRWSVRCPLIHWSRNSAYFSFWNVNLMEEWLFVSFFKASALKIWFCRIFKSLTLSTLLFIVSFPLKLSMSVSVSLSVSICVPFPVPLCPRPYPSVSLSLSVCVPVRLWPCSCPSMSLTLSVCVPMSVPVRLCPGPVRPSVSLSLSICVPFPVPVPVPVQQCSEHETGSRAPIW